MGTENDLPGISLKDEQRQLQNIIGIAQDNLDRAKKSVKKLTDDLEDLRDVYEAQDKEVRGQYDIWGCGTMRQRSFMRTREIS